MADNLLTRLLNNFKSGTKSSSTASPDNRSKVVGASFGKTSGFTSDYRTDGQLLLQASYDPIVSRCIKLITNNSLAGGYKIKSNDSEIQKLLDKITDKLDIIENSKFLLRSSLGAGGDCIAYLVEYDGKFKLHIESTNWHGYRRLNYNVNPYTKRIFGNINVVDRGLQPIATIDSQKVITYHTDNLQSDYLGFTPLMEIYTRVLEKQKLINNNLNLAIDGNKLFGVFSPKLDMLKGASPSEQANILLEVEMATQTVMRDSDNLKNYAYLSLPFDYTRIQANNNEIQYLDTVRSINYEICATFGVPPSLVQFDPANDPNLSNSAQYRDNFSELNTNDNKEKLEQFWTAVIKTILPNVEFNFYIAREETDESIALRDQFRKSIDDCVKLQALGINAKPNTEGLQALGIVIDNQETENLTVVDSMESSVKSLATNQVKYKLGKFYDGQNLVETIIGEAKTKNKYKIILNFVTEKYIYAFNFESISDIQKAINQEYKISLSIDDIQEVLDNPVKEITKAIRQIIKWNKLELGIDYQAGEDRFGYGKKLKCRYGHIRNYIGLDNEALDCYVGEYLTNQFIYKITQLDVDGEIDEYKFMIGFKDINQAKTVYLQQIPKRYFGGIATTTIQDLEQYKKKQTITKTIKKPVLSKNAVQFDKLIVTKGYKKFKSVIHDNLKSQLDKLFGKLAKETKNKSLYSDSNFYDYIIKQLPKLTLDEISLVELMQSTLIPNILEQYNLYYDYNYTMDNLPSLVIDTITNLAKVTLQGEGAYKGVNATTVGAITGTVKQILAKDNIELDDYATLSNEDKYKVVEYLQSEGKNIILRSRTDLLSELLANNTFNQVHENLARVANPNIKIYAGVITRRDENVRGKPQDHISNDRHYYDTDQRNSSIDEGCRCNYIYGTKESMESRNYLPLIGYV